MQIYKIYINERALILMPSRQVALVSFPKKDSLIIRYTGKVKQLMQCVDSLEKGSPYERIVVHGKSMKKLKKDIKSLFNVIRAGGGLVINEKKEALFIFRRGHWDLPKGKCDPGESKKAAAKREVEEETGVSKLKRHELLIKTRHVYRTRSGKRMLKLTNWYHMTAPDQKLKPEAKEQIEKAVWLSIPSFRKKCKPTFKSVLEVLNVYEELREETPIAKSSS